MLRMLAFMSRPVTHRRRLVLSVAWIVAASIAPAAAAETVALSVDASRAGAKIDRNIFGQFAEHLGHGIYEGVFVGSDSKVPNTRGIRNDVVAALRALKVPNVRWPGGCFADEYHWRKGVGPRRTITLNPNWGGVTEPNSFGTHELMDFLQQIGAEAYLSVNVGSGTPQEAAEWLEYLTTSQPTALAKERAANGACLMGLRFTSDMAVPEARFDTLRRELGDAFIAVEIDSSKGNPHGIPRVAHSVLTEHFVDEPGHPTRDALDRVLAFFAARLATTT